VIGSPLIIAEKARSRLQAVLAGLGDNQRDTTSIISSPLPNPADLIICACEINEKHGTGTLLLRIFSDWSSVISARTGNFYDADQTFGAVQLCLPLAQSSRPEIWSWLRWYLSGANIRLILVVPYTPAEVTMAIAASDITRAPICTYVMDDKNVCADGISDAAMQELLARSSLRLVISPEMRDAYQAKYRMRCFVVPPVVSEAIIRRDVSTAPPQADFRRGALLGNIWAQRWLDLLRGVFSGSEYSVDWFCNEKKPSGLIFDREKLSRDGITQRDPIAELDLPSVLSNYAFAVVPTDVLDGSSPKAVRAISEFSLPSRMMTIMATAQLPMLVIGSERSAAAGFVRRFELGLVVPYHRDAVETGIATLIRPDTQIAIRKRAAALAPRFGADGVADWIRSSTKVKTAATGSYEALFS
jgi:hypothetical protein